MLRVPKLQYAVDASNRLLVKKDNQQYPLEGEFKIERNNLIFEPNRKSPLLKELDLPKRIKFQGNWHLTKNRDLKLSLVENDYQHKEDELEIRGRIISCEANAIIFETKCKKTETSDKFLLLRLGGRWQADASNELNFLVTKDIEEDTLRFRGAWAINQNQEIIYTYEKQDLIHKTTTQELLTFKGFWQINTQDRISYIFDLKNKSFFEFKVQLEQLDLRGDKREIKYRIGIGVADLKEEKVFSLFGKWRVEPKKNIFFEIDYGKRGIRAIIFGASVFLDKNNEIVFELKDRRETDLGIRVAFNRNFFKGKAALFARLSKLEDDGHLEVGVRIPW